MLETLTIRNYALITKLTISFSPGFNILTGETGAGKSILIGALGLLLGDKADTSRIRTGCDEASVSGVVTVDDPDLEAWLEAHDIPVEEGALIIKRTIRSTGRGAITIQGEPATLRVLDELSGFLVDMHGQHEHQSLLAPAAQRRLLDRYGGLEGEVLAFAELFKEYLAARKQLEGSRSDERERRREREMLSFSIDEIDSLDLQVGEDEELEREVRILSESERLVASSELAKERLHIEGGALAGVIAASREISAVSQIDESLEPLSGRLESLRYELEDIFEELRSYSDHIVFSPERLDEIQERLAELRKLKKKYGKTIEDILQYREETITRIRDIDNYDEDYRELQQRCEALSGRISRDAKELTGKRTETARELEPLIDSHLAGLGMPSARFKVELSGKVGDAGDPVCTANGADTIEFLISANLGEELKQLRQAASGGELSRIMLALKTVFSDSERIGTLVFDEIDAGIGGTVAVAVGEHLARLGEKRQILCISHLASVAAKARKHIVVEKHEADGRTETSIREISGETRVIEIARMLSGSRNEESALEHARSLMG